MTLMGPSNKSSLSERKVAPTEARQTVADVEQQFAKADSALKQGDIAQAKATLDRLLKEHPTHFRSLMLQSAIAMGKAQYSKAEIYVRAALKTLPKESVISLDKAVAITQLIEALTKQGKHREAHAFSLILGGGEDQSLDALKASERSSVVQQKAEQRKGGLTDKVKKKIEQVFEKAKSAGAGEMLKEVNVEKAMSGVSKEAANAKIQDMAPAPLWNHDELHERKVVYVGMRQRAVLNAFREVRIRLLQKNSGDNMVVMVSSLKEGGGGSFFAFNLAATFALDPQKTALYVDCNPYDSSAERYVNGVINFGLSQYLMDDEIQLEQIIYPSGVERVRVIPTAGTNESAAELFNSERMKTFISEIKARYPDRFIILDAPSVESSTEARILAQHCDQALLLVPFGRTTEDEVLSGIDAVGKKRFAGLVFNH